MKPRSKNGQKNIVPVYYGPRNAEKRMKWRVRVKHAKESVTLNGNILHALTANPGVTIGCALSNTATDPENKSAFPHPAVIASFTKSTAVIITHFYKDKRRGVDAEGVLYNHSYGYLVDLNDTGTLKALVKKYPDFMDREFTLRLPRNRTGDHGRKRDVDPNRKPRDSSRSYVPRGALARAVKAGLIDKAVADQLEQIVESQPLPG